MPRYGYCVGFKTVFEGWGGTKYNPVARYSLETVKTVTTKRGCENGRWVHKKELNK